MKKIIKKLLTSISIIVIFLLFYSNVSAVYPAGCSSCQTQGSWCGHNSGAYTCVDSSFCGERVSNSIHCPPGCTCGSYKVVGGNWCTNNCIAVEWCPGPSPGLSPTPFPTPVIYNNSACGPHTFPNQMIAGQSYDITLTMHNTGTKTWRMADNYRLGSQEPPENTIWGLRRIDINPPNDINGGFSHIFAFTVTAPITAGHYSSRWRMVEEWIEWFGPTCGPSDIEVIEQCPDCKPVSLAVNPTNSLIGENVTFNFLSTNEQGDINTTDDWGGGVTCVGTMSISGSPKVGSKTCNVSTAGTHTWTHNWFSDVSECRSCSQSVNYIVVASPKIEGKIVRNRNNVSTSGTCNAPREALDSSLATNLEVWAEKQGVGSHYSGTIWHDGSNLLYSINTDSSDLAAKYDIYLKNTATGYNCSCPMNISGLDTDPCQYQNISSNAKNQDIYLKEIVDLPWWITYGGNAYAAAKLQTDIPSTMSVAMMMAERNSTVKNTPGFPISKTGPIITSTIHLVDSRDRSENALMVGLQLIADENNYQHFWNTVINNNETINTLLSSNRPPPKIYKYSGDLIIDNNNGWALSTNEESIVVFIDGNLFIQSDQPNKVVTSVKLDSKGILMFIVTGNIEIDGSVGYEKTQLNENKPLLEGIFIADKKIIIKSNGSDDLIFLGAGNFIGWEGIELKRDLGNDNENYAVHSFQFRPDFITKFPRYLKYNHLYRIESSPSW